MQAPKFVKTMLKWASFFVVMTFVILFILMAKDNSQTSQGTFQPSDEKINSQMPVFYGEPGNYTSEISVCFTRLLHIASRKM